MVKVLAVTVNGADISRDPDLRARVLADVVKNFQFAGLLGLASTQGRDVFARVAAFLDVPLASDLGADGDIASDQGRPIVLLVSASDCPYCEALKDHVLPGMERDGRIILRELMIDVPHELRDFSGNPTSHPRFASARRWSFTPVVVFLDGHGQPVVEPIIGVTSLDFYGYYLDQRIREARQILASRSP